MKNLLLLLLLSLFLFGCAKEHSGLNPQDEFLNGDVSYGNDPAQTMDVYLPAGRSANTTKFLVLIHGGGWNEGDKSDFTIYIDSLRKRLPDWAFFNVNYRLYHDGNNKFPTQENDVKAAVSFILSKKDSFQVSSRYGILGASAGGHLALLQAYKNSVVQPTAVISYFGPTDLASLYQLSNDPYLQLLLSTLTGTTPSLHSDVYQESSPVQFVNSSSCATLLLHGDKDALVPLGQSQLLKAKLDAAGVVNKLVVYPGQGHGWLGTPLSESFTQVQNFLQVQFP